MSWDCGWLGWLPRILSGETVGIHNMTENLEAVPTPYSHIAECGCFRFENIEGMSGYWPCCRCRGQTEAQRKADELQMEFESRAMNAWVERSEDG